MQVTFKHPAPNDLLGAEADTKYIHTEDGEFYARVVLTYFTDFDSWVKFDLYVQLSKADWNALREGKAKFVTGRIEDELPRRSFGEYVHLEPSEDQPHAAHASYTYDCALNGAALIEMGVAS